MNKIQTRIVSLLVAITITIGLLPGLRVNAEVVKEGTCGDPSVNDGKDVTWTLDDAGVLTISGSGDIKNYSKNGAPWNDYIDSIKSIVIGDDVTSIGSYAFCECNKADSIQIGSKVALIGAYAFYKCTSITSITLPDSVKSIGGGAFNGCSGLTSINIPNGVSLINYYTFYGCSSLTSITIPEGVTTIDEYAFKNCSSLTSVEIPASVKTIKMYAFKDCSSLTSITIPEGVTTIEKEAFNNCSSLTSVEIPASVTSYGGWVFEDCTNLKNVTIADGSTIIGNLEFAGCTSLTRINIPDSVTTLGNKSFAYCSALTSVYMDKSLKTQCENKNVFYCCPDNLQINYYEYDITYTPGENGTVSGENNIEKSASTDTINLIVTPATNYVIDTVTVTDSTGSTPIDPDANGNYSFTMPSEDVSVEATFKLDQKTITFANEDGTVLQSGKVDCGTMPSYSGATPAKAADEQYTYTFSGWSPAIALVTGDATYTAIFNSTVNQYTVKFVNTDGTVLQSGKVDYGTTPSYSGETPAKAEDDQYTYTFSGWTPVIVPVTGDATYTAVFTAIAKTNNNSESNEVLPAVTSGIAHVQDIGNVTTYADAETGFLYLGTEGQGKRLESITLYFDNPTSYSGTLEYRVHVQDIGWTDWVTAGNPAGTVGQSKRIEAIEIRLTGELADYYSVFYGVHIQDYGDMQGWVQDGALAGTTGESKRIEALAVVIAPKGMEDNISVQYRVHVQDYGWESSYAADGKMAGTSGQSKRLEGIEMFITGCPYSGGIQYKTHVQDIGWESGWTKNGEMSGTQGQAKRLEGICIELYGEVAEYYDIYYRVHAQDIG